MRKRDQLMEVLWKLVLRSYSHNFIICSSNQLFLMYDPIIWIFPWQLIKISTVLLLVPPGKFLVVTLWDLLGPFSNMPFNMEYPVNIALFLLLCFDGLFVISNTWFVYFLYFSFAIGIIGFSVTFPCCSVRSFKVLIFVLQKKIYNCIFSINGSSKVDVLCFLNVP